MLLFFHLWSEVNRNKKSGSSSYSSGQIETPELVILWQTTSSRPQTSGHCGVTNWQLQDCRHEINSFSRSGRPDVVHIGGPVLHQQVSGGELTHGAQFKHWAKVTTRRRSAKKTKKQKKTSWKCLFIIWEEYTTSLFSVYKGIAHTSLACNKA